MSKLNIGNDLYLKGRIGWRGLSKDEYLKTGDYKIINATALMDGYIDWNNCGFISKERYEESFEIMLQENDILISKDGTLGKIGFVKNLSTPCTIASGIFLLRNTIPEKLDFDYLYHVLKSDIFKDFIRRNKADGSTINHLYQRDLANFEIDLPDIETQKKISNILNALDNKIANNNAINSELEKMAKTIYDYWFLQFEFPDENDKPYKSSGGKMVWNEELKRNIPKKFKVADILSVCQVIDCLHSKKPSYAFENEKYYLLTLENLAKDGTIDLSEKFYISKKDYEEWISRIEVKENDFVVTNAGRAGDVCKIPKNVKCAIGRNITAIRPTDIDPYYLRCFFKSNYLREQILGNLDCGAFFMSFNVKSIKKLKILIPSQTVFDDFIEKVKTIILQIEENIIQNQELASLRDFLLPLLMNGQVTFK